MSTANKILMGASGAGGPVGPSDDEFNRVSFLSHFDGANNGVNNVFDDGSSSNHTITANGDVTQGSFNPYGTNWAVDFSRDANPRLSSPASSDFTLGTGDFTIEFFVFFYTIAGVQKAIKQDTASGQTGFTVATGDGTGKFTFGGVLSETTSDAVANKWYHIAITRNSGVFRIFRNGVQTDTNTSSVNFGSAAKLVYGGSDDLPIKGLMSNLRLVQGTSLYDSNFTTPTSPLTAVTNTKLLTLQSNRFVDNSASGHLVQPNTGTETIGSFGPFLTSSVYDAAVNGASSIGGYVAAATSTDWQFGSGNFTVEFWTYPLGTGSWVIAHGVGDVTGSAISWQYGYGTFDFYYGSSSVQITSPTLTLNSWQHIAVVRNGATITVYKDGVATGTANIGSNSLNTGGTSPFYVGAYPGAASSNINGYLSDVRVVKGTAVYTSAFTPPTAPLTAVTNTKLLLNMADGQAIDSAAQNNLTLYGTAKTSTAQYKFGTASLLLDGNSDYAKTSGYVGSITGGKTIECWVYASSISSKMCIWEWYEDDNNLLRLFFEGGNGNVLRLDQRNGGSTIVGTTGATTLSATTWYHLAATRTAAGAWKVYINGTADTDLSGSESGTTLDITDIPLYLGVDFWATDRYWNGYIDDFRVSELDRYASGNFSPPTAAFADKGQQT